MLLIGHPTNPAYSLDALAGGLAEVLATHQDVIEVLSLTAPVGAKS